MISFPQKRVPSGPAILGFWFTIAFTISASGILYGVPAPILGATNGMLITLSLLTVYFVGSVRYWVLNLDLRLLILYHTVRFIGIAFLLLNARGIIPSEFAIVAGWGDIAVAMTAIAVVIFAMPKRTKTSLMAVFLWNLFGLLDILFVLRTGIGLGLNDPEKMTWITTFPFSLLPTFIVPLIIVTHILIFIRLWKSPFRISSP